MNNRATIRQKLVNALEGFWPVMHSDVPLFYENAKPVDEKNLPDVFLYVELVFNNTEQVDVSHKPQKRFSGTLEIMLFTRETKGTQVLLGYSDELDDFFGFQTLDGVHLGVPNLVDTRAPKGWYGKALRVPFFADSNA